MSTDDLAWRGAVDRALAPLHRAVAHDLRSPLNAVRLNLALVRRALEGDAASGGRWLDVVEKELVRLEGLLEAHLELTASSAASDEARAVDLGVLLRRSEPVLRCLAPRRGVDLTLEPAPARGTWPEGVARRAVVAAVALATGSTPSGGALRVASTRGGSAAHLVLSGESLPAPEQLAPLVAPLAGRVVAAAGSLTLVLPSP